MKSGSQNFRNSSRYTRLKYSFPFKLYEWVFKPSVRKFYQRERQFYQQFLPKCKLIFDVGANDGHKTEVFRKLSKNVVCFEPDTRNLEILQIRFRNNKRVQIVPEALASSEGKINFHIHHEGSAFNTANSAFRELLQKDHQQRWNETIRFTGSRTVKATTLDLAISKYGKPDFVKIDVEGFEWPVIQGLSTAVNCLSLESLFPEFRNELQQSMDHLLHLDKRYQFNMAIHEALVFTKFVSAEEMKDFLGRFEGPHFELIARLPVS